MQERLKEVAEEPVQSEVRFNSALGRYEREKSHYFSVCKLARSSEGLVSLELWPTLKFYSYYFKIIVLSNVLLLRQTYI